MSYIRFGSQNNLLIPQAPDRNNKITTNLHITSSTSLFGSVLLPDLVKLNDSFNQERHLIRLSINELY